MNPLDLIKLIFGGLPGMFSKIKLKDWTVSVNGSRKGPVPNADCGVKGNTLWVNATFMVDGVTVMLAGERPLLGGPATISLDGAAVAGGTLALRKHLHAFPPEVRVEIDFDLPGIVYRFDARASG